MFDNNNKIFAYKISLKLDQYLVALFNLCFDVYIKLNNITLNEDDVKYAVSLFSDTFFEKLEIEKNDFLNKVHGKYAYNKEDFFDTLAIQLNSYYLRSESFVSNLETNEFLYYFKDKFSIYSTLAKKNEVQNSLNDKFKTINVIGEIIGYLSDEKLKDSIKSISTIYDLNKAGQYISVNNQEPLKPQFLNVKTDLLNFELLEKKEIDIENIWVNYNHEENSELKFNHESDEYFVVLDKELKDNNVIGLQVNDHVLLKYGFSFGKYINKESYNIYLWKLAEFKF